MAEVFVSPGVYTQEIDDTFVPAGAGTIGAALIGRTVSGPAFRPIRVNNFSEFRNTFGGADVTKYMPYAAKSYLRNGSPLTVVRVLGKGTSNAGQVGVIAFPNVGIEGQTSSAGLSSSNTVYATIRRRADRACMRSFALSEFVLLSLCSTSYSARTDLTVPGI